MIAKDLQSIAFPTLEARQIEALSHCTSASLKKFTAGEILFDVGDREFNFFIVRSGEVEIQQPSNDRWKPVTVHKPGAFTGDISHLTGGAAVVRAVAKGDCEVYQVAAESLRNVLNGCPDFSDIILQAFIARRQLLRESGDFTGLRVIGSRYSQDTFRVREFLSSNRVMFTWLDLEADPAVDKLLKQFGLSEQDTPVVAVGDRLLLRNPSNRELADAVGIRRPLERKVYDLIIVGAGPAGLAAAVYAASEGLDTVVLERRSPGGQAGRSMRIENYLGFPTGITGSDLADRAVLQADKFGARLSIPTPVTGLAFEERYPVLKMDDGESLVGKCLLIATGAEYRLLGVEGCERFEGRGVYYAATPVEAQLCGGADVVVVGGGNSAGQAAVYLAGKASKVFVVVRGESLYQNMSAYLARRIEHTPQIEVMLNTVVKRMSGNDHLATAELVNNKTGEERTQNVAALFSFIGAVPRTDWLPKEIETDENKFVRTGSAVAQALGGADPRKRFLLETSHPGVFAAGDVRSGSIKRVASAVGEGSMAVQFVHEYLRTM